MDLYSDSETTIATDEYDEQYCNSGRYFSNSIQPQNLVNMNNISDININTKRSGKWTSAEESYAKKIITLFKAGTLPDVKPNCTLRVYLSHKLHCSPMRISKKFAGLCAGKVRKINYSILRTFYDINKN